eukprot:TRINITY_DN107285_c0_g1_i1.p2 TRINITY_DN107285_c0_g1~~TRINITY_DN107285_c0_g1_i1.p2  ORF type:complete len:181 (-),score=14.80 TRINITY_DN107285_c0_g1_i1:50-592(-)
MTGTLIQAFNQHQGDILALTWDEDGDNVIASGTDVKVVLFRRDPNNRESGWVVIQGKRIHSHDTRAMVLFKPSEDMPTMVVSGGQDACLYTRTLQSNFQMSVCVQLNIIPQKPIMKSVGITNKRSCLLCAHKQSVELWTMPNKQEPPKQLWDTKEAAALDPPRKPNPPRTSSRRRIINSW